MKDSDREKINFLTEQLDSDKKMLRKLSQRAKYYKNQIRIQEEWLDEMPFALCKKCNGCGSYRTEFENDHPCETCVGDGYVKNTRCECDKPDPTAVRSLGNKRQHCKICDLIIPIAKETIA